MSQREARSDAVTLRDIYAARARIDGHVRRTPLVPAERLSGEIGAEIHLKLECLQTTGSFKLRGATNRVLALSRAERKRGVVTMSTGNHGRAVAYAARRVGAPAIICMSELVPDNKVLAIEALGAEARIVGRSQDEAAVEAMRLVVEEGMTLIPPFDDRHVIAGQGTIGLELLEALPDIDMVLVPLSGGGLIGGIALVLKDAAPEIRVVGVSMERGAAMAASLKAGRPVAVEEMKSLADSLGGGIGEDNRYTLALAQALIDQIVLLSEAEIAAGMRYLFHEERLVAEGGAAVGIGALLAGKIDGAAGRVAVVVSGANVDMQAFLEVVSGGATHSKG